MVRFDILLRFVSSPADGAAHYGAFRERIEVGLGARARDVSDDAAYGSAGCHALLVSAAGESREDALTRVRDLMREAALASRTCTAARVIAWPTDRSPTAR